MAYSGCFSLGRNLDFLDFLQKKFYNIDYWNFANRLLLRVESVIGVFKVKLATNIALVDENNKGYVLNIHQLMSVSGGVRLCDVDRAIQDQDFSVIDRVQDLEIWSVTAF